jgi:hypothetical protein
MYWAAMPETAVTEDRQTDSRKSDIYRSFGSFDPGVLNAKPQTGPVEGGSDVTLTGVVSSTDTRHPSTYFK